jgi:hypothetical protein
MKRFLIALALVAILLIAWVVPVAACETGGSGGNSGGNTGSTTTCWGTSFFYKIGEGTVTAQLIDNKSVTVGAVIVWENSDGLNIRYVTTDLDMVVTRLFVGRGSTTFQAESRIPQDRKGNYDLIKFDDFSQPDNTLIYTYPPINEDALGNGKWKGSWLCIAANADVTKGNKTYRAWGDLVPVNAWKLPKTVNLLETVADPGTNNTYCDLQLSNIKTGKGYSLNNGLWFGWCADYSEFVDLNTQYNAAVYSSLNLTGAPTNITEGRNWDMVNYVINHFDPDADYSDVQFAIWYFNYTPADPSDELYQFFLLNISPEAWDLIYAAQDALKDGKKFIPGPGQVAAVILDPGQVPDSDYYYQPLFIDLCVPTQCYKENTCHHSCDPGWTPCQNNWEPKNTSYQCNWNPGSFSHFDRQSNCNTSNSLSLVKKYCFSYHK